MQCRLRWRKQGGKISTFVFSDMDSCVEWQITIRKRKKHKKHIFVPLADFAQSDNLSIIQTYGVENNIPNHGKKS